MAMPPPLAPITPPPQGPVLPLVPPQLVRHPSILVPPPFREKSYRRSRRPPITGPGAELFAAARRGNVHYLRHHLEAFGVSVDLKDSFGKTALMCTDNIEVAALLLEYSADVHLQDEDGKNVLELTSDIDIAAMLIHRGAKDTLFLAAERDDVKAVRQHLDSETQQVHAREWDLLCTRKHMVALLLVRGATDDMRRLLTDQLPKDAPLVLAAAADLDEDQLGKMLAGLTAPLDPHVAFSKLVHWMEEADTRARYLRSADPRSADEHADLFVRLQLAAAAFLENQAFISLGCVPETAELDAEVQELLSHSVTALNTALRISAKELFAQPVMQRYVDRVWLGKYLHNRLELLLLVLANLPFLPVVALVPPLDRLLMNTHAYCLHLPLVKFFLEFASDLALALTFTLLPAATIHNATAVSLLLLWVVSGIIWEAKQVKGDVRGHFADYFNRYDLAALVMSTATLAMAAATLHNGESTQLQDMVGIQHTDQYWASTRALAILFLCLRTLRVLLVPHLVRTPSCSTGCSSTTCSIFSCSSASCSLGSARRGMPF